MQTMDTCCISSLCVYSFFCQAEDGIRYLVRSRGLGDGYKRQVLLGLAPRCLEQGRLGDIEVAAVDYFRHLPVEEREEQRADMAGVHVRGGHGDELGITCLFYTSGGAAGGSSGELGGCPFLITKM